jgi:hypothetical protein
MGDVDAPKAGAWAYLGNPTYKAYFITAKGTLLWNSKLENTPGFV